MPYVINDIKKKTSPQEIILYSLNIFKQNLLNAVVDQRFLAKKAFRWGDFNISLFFVVPTKRQEPDMNVNCKALVDKMNS